MTTYDQRKNLAAGVVLTAPVPATTGVTIILQAGQGAFFPAPPFNATLWPANTVPTIANAEFVRVTAVVGDTLTITRAQQGSTGKVAVVGFQIAETWTALDLQNIERVLGGKILYVNGTTGSNATGLPYLTIKAAVTAAAAGDTIIVYPGTYVENNLMKAGIVIHLMAGVIISYADAGGDPADFTIFDDLAPGAAGAFKVTGEGQIVYSIADPANPGIDDWKGAVNITNIATTAEFHFAKITMSVSGTGNSALGAAVWVKNCLLVKLYVAEMVTTGATGGAGAAGVYWEKGEMHCFVDRNICGYYPVYCLEPVGLAAVTNFYYNGQFVSGSIAGLYVLSLTSNYRVWFSCLLVTASVQGPISTLGPGRCYVDCQKIEVTSGSTAIINSANLWLRAGKVSGGIKWIDHTANTAYITVQEFEDTGSMVDGIVVSAGSLYLFGGRVHLVSSVAANQVLKHTGGVTRVFGTVLDSSSRNVAACRPVLVSAVGLSLHAGTLLIAGAAADSGIFAAAAQTVKFVGSSTTTKAAHANITQQPLASLVLDANAGP